MFGNGLCCQTCQHHGATLDQSLAPGSFQQCPWLCVSPCSCWGSADPPRSHHGAVLVWLLLLLWLLEEEPCCRARRTSPSLLEKHSNDLTRENTCSGLTGLGAPFCIFPPSTPKALLGPVSPRNCQKGCLLPFQGLFSCSNASCLTAICYRYSTTFVFTPPPSIIYSQDGSLVFGYT